MSCVVSGATGSRDEPPDENEEKKNIDEFELGDAVLTVSLVSRTDLNRRVGEVTDVEEYKERLFKIVYLQDSVGALKQRLVENISVIKGKEMEEISAAVSAQEGEIDQHRIGGRVGISFSDCAVRVRRLNLVLYRR
uniref:Uncharacterized protein n=1 Tax=Chromera velia CCMP2878 TaxID=1169474 RepID=A0A0G4H6T4_9ALVE|eukprot:Cvel_24862.t1-p1 / transcript=Cvel_24862.t1 / gene=Cvel_24862 / organism=Chromera_velia_CCMP2878 / gene_product=hypothetical protein / transcript_product=hypothetical protein / location=Cvel_scaffold2746:1769-2173(+) / protein_length=135 / sequence_SO=supercontig / SO=protein_coding / is_pseudo=false